MESSAIGLPPNCELRAGNQIVRVGKEHKNGREVPVERPVALTIEEARKTGADYYDPRFGWIIGGRKRASESFIPRPVESLFASSETDFKVPDEDA